MARHILFTSQKGGVGKSTLARSTAVALAYAGRKVLLADFDVEQRTCLRWQVQRQARRLEPTITVAKFSKEAKLDRASDQCDDVVMDTRGQHDTLSLDLAMASDVIFLPSSFSLDDISPTLDGRRRASQRWHSVLARSRRVLPHRRVRTAGAACAVHPGNERHRRPSMPCCRSGTDLSRWPRPAAPAERRRAPPYGRLRSPWIRPCCNSLKRRPPVPLRRPSRAGGPRRCRPDLTTVRRSRRAYRLTSIATGQ